MKRACTGEATTSISALLYSSQLKSYALAHPIVDRPRPASPMRESTTSR
jgi:hypothetical protein